MQDMFSSKRGTCVLLRIPYEFIAEKITDDLIDMRGKLKLQNLFEVIDPMF